MRERNNDKIWKPFVGKLFLRFNKLRSLHYSKITKLLRILITTINPYLCLSNLFDTSFKYCLINVLLFLSRSRFRVQHVIIIGAIVAALIIAVIIGLSAYARSSTSDSRNDEFLVPPDPESFQPPSWSKLRTFKRGAVCADGAPCAVIGKYVCQRRVFFSINRNSRHYTW